MPEQKIDLARTKLTLDRMIDPRIDISANLKKIDAMVSRIKARMPRNASQIRRMEILQEFIYKPGRWNGNQIFQYDLNDPLGRTIGNKLLPNYLSTRLGNCVSMPLLFIILGERIGIDLTVASAPSHVFVKYRGDDGHYYNFEATSGGAVLDSSLRRDFPMTDLAVANGLYLRALTKRETVALMLGTLMEFYSERGWYERLNAIASLVLEKFPNDHSAMLHKGHAYYGMVRRDFINRYPTPTFVPAAERARMLELNRNNREWFARAEALGWREPTKEIDEGYLQRVEKVKSIQQREKAE